MINIDLSLFIQIANFLLMMIVLNYLLYRPLRSIIKERKARFEGLEANISGLAGQLDEKTKDLSVRLAAARRDGHQKMEELKGQGTEEEKKLLTVAASQAEDELKLVKDQIKGEVSSARSALKGQVDIFARDLATKVLGRNL